MDVGNGYLDSQFYQILNFTQYEEDIQSQKFNSTVNIQIEKTISHLRVCYNFNPPQDKIKRPRFSKENSFIYIVPSKSWPF